MTSTTLILVGNGGHAREIAWLCTEATENFRCIGYLDENEPSGPVSDDFPFLGGIERAADHLHAHFAIAIGAPRVRSRIAASLADCGVSRFARIVHQTATIGRDCELGAGAQVCAGVRMTTNVRVGRHAIFNQNSTIAHDSDIGDFVTVAPLAAISGNVTVRNGVEIGTQACLRQGLTVDEGAMLGMGAVAIRDVGANSLVVGNPARVLRQLDAFT